MMGRFLKFALLSFLFWIQAALLHAAEEKKTAVLPSQPNKDKTVLKDPKPKINESRDTRDKEVVAHLEMLKIMDMLEKMDLMKDMDVIEGGKKK